MQKTILALCALLTALTASAADPRERVYNYEILVPSHQAKPRVEGHAAERVAERLGRGLTAAAAPGGKGVYLQWRMLAEEHPSVGYLLFRRTEGETVALTRKPLVRTSDFTDTTALFDERSEYWIVPTYDMRRGAESEHLTVTPSDLHAAPAWRSIPLRDGQTAGRVALADLDGDGRYDFVVRTPDRNIDPGMPGDRTGMTYTLSAYLADGTWLWSYDLGQGIEPGVWYSPFVVYDFDGDGCAEVALKTAPGAVRDENGRVGEGEERLTVLDGMTGREIAHAPWIERSWRFGDLNRQNRNQMGMAYLDGRTPAILTARGTYRCMVVEAWELHEGALRKLWRWDGDEENPVVRSQGAHSMVTADVDGDGRDEILLGSCMLDDNGTLLWSAGVGHTDKAYLTDIDPARPGMEVMLCCEVSNDAGRGVCTVDAATGAQVWNIGHPTSHVGDGMVADFDPAHPGPECFASEDRKGGRSDRYLLTARGERIEAAAVPGCRNWAWWDGDRLRETFVSDRGADAGGRGQRIVKWPDTTLDRGFEGPIVMIADLEGDWREEVITAPAGELRIYRTRIPASDRRPSLMQDPLYRSYVLHRSMGYPQSPVPSYYLGQ
ncbi:silent information regulator protein Sir2 [Alistipes sp.]|uniref:rhamnogalacturonan lyase family protein n=1 Tax=Alistipes sp. TaxID=1872444 RepID=UPI003AF0A8FA